MIKRFHEQLREQASALTFDDCDRQALRDEALNALDECRLDDARAALKQLLRGAGGVTRAHMGAKVTAGLVEGALGWLAMLRREYRLAASHFHDAGRILPPNETARRHDYRFAEASAHFRDGQTRGQEASLRHAITLLRACLRQTPRPQKPAHWRDLQNELGNALLVLADHDGETAALKKAVAAFRAAADDALLAAAPTEWAMLQTKAGLALTRLGERESKPSWLDEGIATLRSALARCSREQMPLGWALTQNYLGMALCQLGQQQAGTAKLSEAVSAFRAALEERTRTCVPLSWARTQHHLGIALCALAERGGGTVRLREAEAAFRCALMERTREWGLDDWASTRMSLGSVLASLGVEEGNRARLIEAIAIHRQTLAELEETDSTEFMSEIKRRMSDSCQALSRLRQGTSTPSSVH